MISEVKCWHWDIIFKAPNNYLNKYGNDEIIFETIKTSTKI